MTKGERTHDKRIEGHVSLSRGEGRGSKLCSLACEELLLRVCLLKPSVEGQKNAPFGHSCGSLISTL